MKKNIFLVTTLIALIALLIASTSSVWAWGDDAATKKDAEEIKRMIQKVKSDTGETVDILRSITLGTLPQGGTLTNYADRYGINVWVLAGHNGLKVNDLDKMPSGWMPPKGYPKTAHELEAARKAGDKIRKEYYAGKVGLKVAKLEADEVRAKEIKVKLIQTERMEANQAYIKELNAELVKAKKIIADLIEAQKVITKELQVTKGKIASGGYHQPKGKSGQIAIVGGSASGLVGSGEGMYNDSAIPSLIHWHAIDGNIDLVIINKGVGTPYKTPRHSSGKLWKGRPQVVIYNFRGGNLEGHPGFLKALAHARAIRDGKFGDNYLTDNCHQRTFPSIQLFGRKSLN